MKTLQQRSVQDSRLLFGPLAGVLLAAGVAALARWVPGYSHVQQTVSEIGQIGSPVRIPFAVLLLCVAVFLGVFALGLLDRARATGESRLVACLVACMALSAAGVGVFAHPHPLHNVFGLSELIGYQAPLALALTWRGDRRLKALVVLSWLAFLFVWIAIGLNLASLWRDGWLWQAVKPRYGLAQRALFAAWFGWCAMAGLFLFLAPAHRGAGGGDVG